MGNRYICNSVSNKNKVKNKNWGEEERGEAAREIN